MRGFDLLQPKTLAAALDALAQNDPNTHLLSGGTDLIVDIRSGRAAPDVLIALQDVAELRGIHRENGTLKIGAATTISEFLTHPDLVPNRALAQAAYVFANPMIRNTATIAGNLNSASPAGDMLPPLLALDAKIELVSVNAARIVPINEFFLSPRTTVKRPDELISSIHLPSYESKYPTSNSDALHRTNTPISNIQHPTSNIQHPTSSLRSPVSSNFYKLGLRRADAISIISVAVRLERDGDIIHDVRIALGAVAPRPIRALGAEDVLRGQTFSDTNVRQAAALAAQECSPIDDLHASANYRRRMIAVYVRRLLEQTWNQSL